MALAVVDSLTARTILGTEPPILSRETVMQILRWFPSGQPPKPDDGPVTYVIGDIHGCLAPLDKLLAKITPRAEDEVVFVGDYIDRGPQSREVVERLSASGTGASF